MTPKKPDIETLVQQRVEQELARREREEEVKVRINKAVKAARSIGFLFDMLPIQIILGVVIIFTATEIIGLTMIIPPIEVFAYCLITLNLFIWTIGRMASSLLKPIHQGRFVLTDGKEKEATPK